MNITVIGHVCIDNNISEHATYTGAGSPAIFMAKIFAKFPRTDFRIIAPYGKDYLPFLKNITIYPQKTDRDWTLIYENKARGNNRTQKAFNREFAQPPPITDEMRKIIECSDLIFFAPLLPNYPSSYIQSLFENTGKCIKILMPQGYYRNFDDEGNVIQREFVEADELLHFFNFVIVSEQDHKTMKETCRRWSKKTNVILTLGDKGSLYMYKDNHIQVASDIVPPGNIVDSVGSGDIFSASFGYEYYRTKDIGQSLSFANDIARQCLFYPANNLQFILPK